MSARSLIVGASGLIGSAISRAAGTRAVRASVDWRTPRTAVESLRPILREFLRPEIGEVASRRIYWAAGRSVISSSAGEVERELETFQDVHRAMLKHRTSPLTFVLVSSAGALFRGARGAAISESTRPDPGSPYGAMKLAQENVAIAGSEQNGHSALILRAPSVYGPQQDPEKPQGLVSTLLRSVRASSMVTIHVPRDSRRHYLWVDDLARVALHLPRRMAIAQGESAVRVVVTERSRTIDEVIGTVARVVRRQPVVRFMPANHSTGHGFDLTLRSEFPDAQPVQPFTGLAAGICCLINIRGAI